MNKTVKFVGIALVAVLALGLAAFGGIAAASAQTVTPTPNTPLEGGGRGPRGPHGPGGDLGGLIDEATHQSILAEALGISVEELQTALAAGKTLQDIATAKGMDAATLQTNLETARNKVIDQLVMDGKLTQAQADALKQGAANCLLGGGRGQHRGPRGDFGLFGRTQTPTVTSTPTP